MLKERFLELETQLLRETRAVYGERLVSVVVYGSVGRGTQRRDSDLDVLIIARDLPKGRMNRTGEFDGVEQRLERHLDSLIKKGVRTFISAVIKSPSEAEMGSPLFLDMVEDARILYDRDDFVKKLLGKLKKKLESLGAKRLWKGSSWYWDLKPDYRPGDVIEL